MARYGDAAVTDAEREAAASRLREHYAAGRLPLDEFQDRLDALYRAQTARELSMVTDSLPHGGVVFPPDMPWDSYLRGRSVNVDQVRAAMARAGRRIMLAFAVVTAGSLLLLTLLITAFIMHGGLVGIVLAAFLAIVAIGVAAVGALVWMARRLWRRRTRLAFQQVRR